MLEPYASKGARTVRSGGKSERIYLSQLALNKNTPSDSTDTVNGLSPTCEGDTKLIKAKTRKPENDDDKGYVRIDGRLVLITLAELRVLIEDSKRKVIEDYQEKRFNSDYLSSLRSLLNGVFAAEGS